MAYSIKWFDTVDSTNYEALRQSEISEDFTVFAAKFQTNGRGQKGKSWESAVGENLTFSILVKPNFLKVEDQFLISEVVTLGIVNYLSKIGIDAKIKWPNDIYVKDKKICGILIEHYISGDKLSASIIGIGLNLNQGKFNSDAPNPTSVINETGIISDLDKELGRLTSQINDLYRKINIKSYERAAEKMNGKYLGKLYRLNEYHRYVDLNTNEEYEAKITGIDKCACLLLERRDDGSSKSYAFKEIRYLLDS